MVAIHCSECSQVIVGTPKTLNKKKLCRNCYDKEIIKITEQEDDRKNLIEYVKNLFKLSSFPVEWEMQINNFIKEDKSYTGIQKTLYYFYEIMGNELLTTYGLSIVKYKYEEAKQYFMKMQEIREKNKEIDFTPKIINIVLTNTKKRIRKCNIEDL